MKICILIIAVMLSSTLVVGLSIHQPNYSTRQAQEEYLREHGYYGDCVHDDAFGTLVVDSKAPISPEVNEGLPTFEGDIIGDFEEKEKREPIDQGPVYSTEQMFSKVVRCFQRKFGLQETGEVNEETRKEMETPNSGVHNRWKRFVTFERWNKTNLTYYIENYDLNRTIVNITEQEIRSTIQRAMKFWTDESGLTVTEKNSTDADIRIGFYYGDHNDGNPFDGPEKTLAHAAYPQTGFLHFDASERWSLSSEIDFLRVAMHEVGHAIGIAHSEKGEAIMWEYTSGFNPNITLNEDDIFAVRSLYGGNANDQSNWNWSCNFELADDSSYWCGMSQASDDQFDWTLLYGPTPSDPTGPYPAFSGSWYLYLDTSNPHPPNDTAKIYIPSPILPGNYCLAFRYRMFGFHIRELQVFREANGEGQPETIWRKSKEQGNDWLFAQLTVNIDVNQKIGFIGVSGDDYSGNIALDALSLTSNACK